MWDYYEYAVRLLIVWQDTDALRAPIANLRPKLLVRIPVNSVRIFALCTRAVHRI